jgi:hypothetical protein
MAGYRKVAGALLAFGLIAAVPAVASATSGTLPGGTGISVDITGPPDGTTVPANTDVPVTATASVGGGTVTKDTSVVFVLDVSGSMSDSAGIDCTGDATIDSRLVCQKVAATTVNTAAAASASTVLNAAVVSFAGSATVVQALSNDFGAVAGAINGLGAAGGTNYQAALDGAAAALAGAATNKVVVFISDGASTTPVTTVPAALSGTQIRTFAIGAANCGDPSSTSSLAYVASRGDPGSSSCIPVDAAALPGLGGFIAQNLVPTLDSVRFSANGGTPIPATAGGGGYSATVPAAQLTPGTNQICATATGTDSGGTSSVTDCISVVVDGATVDCGAVPSAQCTLTVTDTGVATAVATGRNGFDKQLTLSVFPADGPTECGGSPCLTAFNVQFPDEGVIGSGKVVELVVTMTRENSTPPGRAAVFLEGAQITQKCTGRNVTLPCASIRRVSGGRTEYLVRFDGDPIPKFR